MRIEKAKSREGKSSNSINTKIERRSSNIMFPNFLIPKLRQLTMRDVIHISDRNTAASRTRFVQLSYSLRGRTSTTCYLYLSRKT